MPFPFAFAWLNAIQAVRHSHSGFTVLLDEPVEHVYKYCVWVLHPDRLVCLVNCLGKICKENFIKGQIHRDNISSCFLVAGMCGFLILVLIVRFAGRDIRDCVNFFRIWTKLDGYILFVKNK